MLSNGGQPLHNGAPAGILVKGDGNRVWDSTIFNVSSGQGELVAITEFGQNRHSEFFNVAARRIDTRHGLPLSNASHGAPCGPANNNLLAVLATIVCHLRHLLRFPAKIHLLMLTYWSRMYMQHACKLQSRQPVAFQPLWVVRSQKLLVFRQAFGSIRLVHFPRCVKHSGRLVCSSVGQ